MTNPPANGAPERLVLCLRKHGRDGADDELVDLLGRAEAQGARVVAWQSGVVAFDFEPDAIEDAVELVLTLPPQFSAGVAQGALAVLVEAGSKVALSSGEALRKANQLARVARAGEVLLSPALPQAQSGEVLTRGSRLGLLGKERVRGLRLDLTLPLRPGTQQRAPAALAWLERELPELPVPGQCIELCGPRGAGGTRAIFELTKRAGKRRTMELVPRLGEPLGALRVACGVLYQDDLSPELSASRESLCAGEGLEIDVCAELLEAALGDEGVVFVDDAERVDGDSLDAVMAACNRGKLGVLLRRTAPGSRATESVNLGDLADDAAQQLVHALVPDLASKDAVRLARRGSQNVLSVRESTLEAAESGLLVEKDGATVLRVSVAGRNRPFAAQHWIERRLRWFSEADQLVLGALAVWGGEATIRDLEQLVEREEQTQVSAAVAALRLRGWLRAHTEIVTFAFSSVRDVALASLPEARRARLHRRASAWLAKQDTPLWSVSAGVHALLGGDVDGALPLLRRGGSAARAAGLVRTAEALDRFTETGEPDVLESRGLLGGAIADRAGLQRESVPPVSLTHPTGGPEFLAESPTATRFVQALRDGDHTAALELASELQAGGVEPHIALRLEGMACLARDDVAKALSCLRQAKDLAEELSAVDRSRASLALAVGLARGGRFREALLEGLNGLARAREAEDRQGQHVTARFLAQLSETAGDADAQRGWRALGERIPSRPPR